VILPLLLAATAAAPWAGGERLDYTLHWMGMRVGTMTLTARDAGENWAFFLATQTEGAGAKIYPVEQELESLVRKADFQTLYFRKWEHKPGKPEKEGETLLDLEGGWLYYRDFKPLPWPCVDTLSFIHLLRLSPAVPRAPPRAYDRGKFYRLTLQDQGEREITVAGRRVRARKVVPKMVEEGGKKPRKGSMVLWLGPGPSRLPLRIDFSIPLGTLRAELACEPQEARPN
jgi:hypothetical protein